MRKIIVRLCALSYFFRIGKRTLAFLRISPLIVLTMLSFIILQLCDSGPQDMDWWDWIPTSLFLVLIWIGFSWFGLGYFQLWPVKWEELDDMQKYQYYQHEHLEQYYHEYQEILKRHPKWR
jgi:hypothetical protein